MTEDRKGIKSFEDLEVFQRAYRISLKVHRKTLLFPKEEQYGLADQMRKASKSICVNLAEGFGKQDQSSAEFKRYISIAIGSSDEMRVWLRYSLDLEYIEERESGKNGEMSIRRYRRCYRDYIEVGDNIFICLLFSVI
jgi:four helix bundle protein